MPTKQELDELADKCVWTITTYDYVDGYKVTGPNGNSIFLPRNRYNLLGSWAGHYWSSTPSESDAQYAYGLHFDNGDCGYHVVWYNRYEGISVRPVTDK